MSKDYLTPTTELAEQTPLRRQYLHHVSYMYRKYIKLDFSQIINLKENFKKISSRDHDRKLNLKKRYTLIYEKNIFNGEHSALRCDKFHSALNYY